jgi:hypothetical protein
LSRPNPVLAGVPVLQALHLHSVPLLYGTEKTISYLESPDVNSYNTSSQSILSIVRTYKKESASFISNRFDQVNNTSNWVHSVEQDHHMLEAHFPQAGYLGLVL